mmetsp:Transcript_49499/g.150642  ORF Transcript_49499/g.150642 Transcript_49499/m.150642 type:complete len:204 (-) Transcript_49499:337-948(-)
MSWLLMGSLSFLWMFSTISHSGPRPLNSASSSHWPPKALRRCSTSSGDTTSSNLCRASANTAASCFVSSSSCRDVCVTRRWKPRQGMGRDRNFCGICFSCRFRSLRKPATLISKYCACWLATSTNALYSATMPSNSLADEGGSLCMRNSISRLHNADLSSAPAGRTPSSRSSCASPTSNVASMRWHCIAANLACNRASPRRTC